MSRCRCAVSVVEDDDVQSVSMKSRPVDVPGQNGQLPLLSEAEAGHVRPRQRPDLRGASGGLSGTAGSSYGPQARPPTDMLHGQISDGDPESSEGLLDLLRRHSRLPHQHVHDLTEVHGRDHAALQNASEPQGVAVAVGDTDQERGVRYQRAGREGGHSVRTGVCSPLLKQFVDERLFAVAVTELAFSDKDLPPWSYDPPAASGQALDSPPCDTKSPAK